MARFRLFSDIHSEFHRDGGRSFVQHLPDVPCDAVVLAGDVGNSRTTLPFLGMVCRRFADVPVLYVTGNHEHYGSGLEAVRGLIATAQSPNLVHLDNTVVEVAGVRVVGATLWFPDDPSGIPYRHMMNDYRSIRNLDPIAYLENHQTRKTISEAGADLVVTHHLPCPAVVAARWAGSDLNRFFVGGDDDLVAASGARVWMFGHTHDATDVTHLGVRMVANPFGYPHEPKAQFLDDLVVEV